MPAGDEPSAAAAAQIGGFSLHAGVSARADERKKLERPCRIEDPAVIKKTFAHPDAKAAAGQVARPPPRRAPPARPFG